MDPRKPPVAMESREPRSIRYCPAEWGAFIEAARARGLEPSALARECSLIGLRVLETPALMEAYIRGLSVVRVNGA